jgi:hypothetical protein
MKTQGILRKPYQTTLDAEAQDKVKSFNMSGTIKINESGLVKS